MEIHKKLAIPSACLVFGLFAVPLGFNNSRGGKSSGFALSIAVITGYYLLLSNGEEWARIGRLPPWLAMWLPNLVFTVLGIFLLIRRNQDKSLLLGGLDRWLRLDGGMPTALTDLSKPAYRLGMTNLDVGWGAHRLKVEAKPSAETYQTRGVAEVAVSVTPDGGGKLPESAEIAFSAVDEALLDLLANPSVKLLDAMMQRRGIEVFTSTAQMQRSMRKTPSFATVTSSARAA